MPNAQSAAALPKAIGVVIGMIDRRAERGHASIWGVTRAGVGIAHIGDDGHGGRGPLHGAFGPAVSPDALAAPCPKRRMRVAR
ncbi:MAG: hypothetical protein AAF914_08180 [Pseudomonadota bacterium]